MSTLNAQLTQHAMQLSTTPTQMSGLLTPSQSSLKQSATFMVCEKPKDWIVYTVRNGDTVYSLAVDTNLLLVTLKAANFLTTNTLAIGQEIFLPYYPLTASTTITTFPTPMYRISIAIPTSTPQPPSGNNPPNVTATTPLTATLPPPATPTNSIIPTATKTRNPLFADTPTPSNTP